MEMEADNQISFLHAWEGNIQLKGGCVDPTEGRDNTEPETWIFPHIAQPKEVQK